MYKVKRIRVFNLLGQLKVNRILYICGKDMAEKYKLQHWNNSYFKNFVIVILCVLKNNIYLVMKNEKAVATFQTRKVGKTMRFEKLASLPQYSGMGVGSFCINYIEEMAKNNGCGTVHMEVYSLSQHALDFYIHRGYSIYGETNTLKYREVKMEKKL